MWEYNETNNYYYYYLFDANRVVIQPLTESYCVRLYLGKQQLVEIKAYIYADSIEEAQEKAMKLVFNHAIVKAGFWNKIISTVDDNLRIL